MKVKYLQYHPDTPDCISTVIIEDTLPAPIPERGITQIMVNVEEEIRGKMIDHQRGVLISYDERRIDYRQRDLIDDGSDRFRR